MDDTSVNGIDLKALYLILRGVARKKAPITYGALSTAYQEKTGEWREAHGTWDEPLGVLNNLLAGAGLPALTVLVVRAQTMEPGNGFWGSCPLVPIRPSNDEKRFAECLRIQKEVYAARWPYTLPGG